MHMMLYERMTFLLVAGTLGLFVLAFLCGAVGVVLTYEPELPKKIVRILNRIEEEVLLIRDGVSARFQSLRTWRTYNLHL